MQAALDDLVALLDLEPIEVNIFRGVSPEDHRQRVFGGQVAGQALVAAALVYASQQRLLGSEIGEKAYPAALVAYLLWACMMLRWASL